MLFTLLLIALIATSGEDTNTIALRGEGHLLRGGCALLPSGLAGSGSQEEGASLTWTGGNTTGEGERETTVHTCQLLTERRESETPKEAQLLALKGAKA